jgi:hypothetical protein
MGIITVTKLFEVGVLILPSYLDLQAPRPTQCFVALMRSWAAYLQLDDLDPIGISEPIMINDN